MSLFIRIRRLQGCALLVGSLGTVAMLLGACAFDASGLGETGSGEVGGEASTSTTGADGSGTSTTTEGTTESSEGSESEGVSGTTTTGGETTGPSTTDPTDPTDPSTTTGVEPCDSPVTVYPDKDMDMFGDPMGALETCDPPPDHVDVAGDCDDGNAAVYLGADEVCDGVDNDCDLKVDEYSAVNSGACNDCKTVVEGESVYYICPDDDDWDGAAAWCGLRGAKLVSINSAAEFALVSSHAKSHGGDFWVGAEDRQKEGVYLWADGTELSVEDLGWAENEPTADGILDLDCVVLGGGWWTITPGRYRTSLCDPIIDPGWICEGELEE